MPRPDIPDKQAIIDQFAAWVGEWSASETLHAVSK